MVIDLIVNGKKEKTAVYHGEVVEGNDISGIKLQITRPSDSEWRHYARFKWRFQKSSKNDDWSYWLITSFSPTERIGDEKDDPTIAQVFKAAGDNAKKEMALNYYDYHKLWKKYGPEGK
jgi:hypothetical protein